MEDDVCSLTLIEKEKLMSYNPNNNATKTAYVNLQLVNSKFEKNISKNYIKQITRKTVYNY
jgi:hypothetical protein